MGKSTRNSLSLPNSLHLFFCQLIQCTFALLWQSFSGAALWASYFVLNPPKNIHTCSLSLLQREKSTSLTVDPSFFLPPSDPTCLFAFPPSSLTLSHILFWKGGLFPQAVLFDNMGHWCCSHITHKHQSMYVLTDLLSDIDKACPEVRRKNLCQIQIRHRHTRTHGWTSDRHRPWTLFTGCWLTSQQRAICSLPTHR